MIPEIRHHSSQQRLKDLELEIGPETRSSSSQDRPIGQLPAKFWPEAFHATFIRNIRERGKTERMEEKLRSYYQYHHKYLPPPLAPSTLSDEEVGGGK